MELRSSPVRREMANQGRTLRGSYSVDWRGWRLLSLLSVREASSLARDENTDPRAREVSPIRRRRVFPALPGWFLS